MAKYTYPSIRTTEIDNTIRNNASQAAIGVGAIVTNSNKGPVNQRVLVNSYSDFTSYFGEPENTSAYGHFAAENFLNNSRNLLVVRATMGDEGYAQIQYPYSDAEDYYKSNDLCEFRYIDNEGTNKLALVKTPSNADEFASVSSEWKNDFGFSGCVFNQTAEVSVVENLESNDQPAHLVYKSSDNVVASAGQYVKYVSKVNVSTNNNSKAVAGAVIAYDDVILKSTSANMIPSAMECIDLKNEDVKLIKFNIDKNDTLNNVGKASQVYFNTNAWSGISAQKTIPYADFFIDDNFWKGDVADESNEDYVETKAASKITVLDWDDCETKTLYVDAERFEDNKEAVVGVSYRLYGMNTNMEDLAVADSIKTIKLGDYVKGQDLAEGETIDSRIQAVNEWAVEQGTDFAELADNKYTLLYYLKPWDNYDEESSYTTIDPKIVYTETNTIELIADKNKNTNLFFQFQELGKKNKTTVSVLGAKKPEQVVIPWQNDDISKMVAFPTSEILNPTNEIYKDGYTPTIETDNDPGNGDIEQYQSNFDNQLVIAAVNPGVWGNDIGISIITPSCAEIAALDGKPNAFDWKYRYDDEDQVDNDDGNADLTYKKVYRINVYKKLKTQTAEAAWGNGMDALLKDPIEFFYVSNDPTAKDGEGKSLYAPNVINGHSEYIYVSRSSVKNAINGAGTYSMPRQTYSIYQLTGGSNSKKNNISEKTAALKLYEDRSKANFDILFNVEAIDSFTSKQRFATHQRRIADIASKREKDIAVIQVTSTSSRSVKTMISEAKMFTFNKGTYVAPYAGYDKYFNSTLAQWIYLPKSVAAACAMAYCDTVYYPWFAPAGVSRGTIFYSSNQLTRLSDDEIGQLYSINVNTSRELGGYGELLWGQKTALKKESELNRINVRRCLNYIEKNLEIMMTPYLFQQNTETTRTSARTAINSFLSRVKAADGILSYVVGVYPDPEDSHIMNVEIHLVPASCIEFIDIKINVDPQSNAVNVMES